MKRKLLTAILICLATCRMSSILSAQEQQQTNEAQVETQQQISQQAQVDDPQQNPRQEENAAVLQKPEQDNRSDIQQSPEQEPRVDQEQNQQQNEQQNLEQNIRADVQQNPQQEQNPQQTVRADTQQNPQQTPKQDANVGTAQPKIPKYAKNEPEKKPNKEKEKPKDCRNDHCANYEFGWKDIQRFNIGAEWLYWKAAEDGLVFGVLNTVSSPTIVDEEPLLPNFEFNTRGYRAWGGFELPCYAWEINAIVTHAPSIRHDLTLAEPNQFIALNPNMFFFNTVLGVVPAGVTGTQVKNRWFLDMDYVDVDLSHTLAITDFLRVRPHLGVRYLWSYQTFQVNFVGSTAAGVPFSLVSKMHNRNWGCGAEAGLWGHWDLSYGISLIGHVGGAILYSKQHIHGDAFIASPSQLATSLDVIWAAIPILDYFIGLHYQTCLADGEIYLRAGWEQHTLFNMNRFTLQDHGNLSLQGLTLGGGLIY